MAPRHMARAKATIKWHAHDCYEGKREEGAQRINFTVGEIDKLDDSVDHGVSHRYEGVYAPQGEPVDQ